MIRFWGFILFVCSPSVVLFSATPDSFRVNQWLDSAAAYESVSPAVALDWYIKTADAARQCKFLKGEATAWYYGAYVLQSMGENGRADSFFRNGLRLYEQIHSLPGVARAYNGIASCAQHSGDYAAAVRYFLQAAEALQQISPPTEKVNRNLATIWFNVAVVFKKTENFPEALRYLQAAAHSYEVLKDTSSLADCYNNLGSLYGAMGDTVQEVLYLQKAYEQTIRNSSAQNSILSVVHVNMGVLAIRRKNLEEARYYYEKALGYARQSSRYETVKVLHELALLYVRLQRWPEADSAQREMLFYGEKNRSLSVLQDAWGVRTRIETARKNYPAALEAHRQYAAYRDSVLSSEQRKTVVELEKQYQTAQKDKEILAQSAEIRRINTWIAVAVGGLLVALLLAILLGNRLRHRRMLHAQEIKTLRQQEELHLMQALITGEEKERSRLARDLHDNIGGLLSAAKMHFQILPRPENPADKENFQKTFDLLDQAAADIRHTAHNLMPETLMRLGLEAALRQFGEKISGGLHIDLQVYGLEKPLSDNQNLLVYRIAQELLHNVLKHAAATEVIVQINRHEQNLSLTVEDNGSGFSPTTASGGMGLSSIETRVKTLGGTMEIQSEQGQGTSVYIQLPLSKQT
ncbi:MAG: sensor histidine kinase [Bacteroidia bacterium]|nr:sensor histidine kinase [Bacteroidia bacterium]